MKVIGRRQYLIVDGVALLHLATSSICFSPRTGRRRRIPGAGAQQGGSQKPTIAALLLAITLW